MSRQALITRTILPSHPFLDVVKTYLDLISGDNRLTYGEGLKRLYVMRSGIATFNDPDISAIVHKASHLNMIPDGLNGFMVSSILKNLYLYGQELQGLIEDRLLDIAGGYITNPTKQINGSPERSRRFYYTPPITFLQRLQKSVDACKFATVKMCEETAFSLANLATEADGLLMQLRISDGTISPNSAAWGALHKVITDLVEVLTFENIRPLYDQDYKYKARNVVKILWVIAKLLHGDLTTYPDRRDQVFSDINALKNISDGTLAALPFPVKHSLDYFNENDFHELSLKARGYLNAVQRASFMKTSPYQQYRSMMTGGLSEASY